MRKIGWFLTTLLLGGWLMSACEEEDCALSTASYGLFAFVDENGRQVALGDTLTVTAPLYSYDSVYVYMSETDTVISNHPIDTLTSANGYRSELLVSREEEVFLNRKTGAKDMMLPFSYTAAEDTFVMRYTFRLCDTLWVKHENRPYFTSMDCGTVMQYRLLDVRSTHHLIDSVKIVESSVTNSLKTNVKIYYTVGD